MHASPAYIQARFASKRSDRLHFSGRGLGQQITGTLDVLAESVHLQVDLPEILAVIAERLTQRVRQEGQKLLSK